MSLMQNLHSRSGRDAAEHDRSRARRMLPAVLGVLAIPLLFALMIVWHECGHTVTAWLVGDATARFELVDLSYPCVGCNLYDSAALAPIPNAIVNLAGVLATQLLAWGAVAVLVRRRHRAVTTWLLADVVLVTLLDLVWQCVQGLLFGAYHPMPLGRSETYVDGSAVVFLLHQATALPQVAIAVALLAIVAADLAALGTVLVVGVRRRRARARRLASAVATDRPASFGAAGQPTPPTVPSMSRTPSEAAPR